MAGGSCCYRRENRFLDDSESVTFSHLRKSRARDGYLTDEEQITVTVNEVSSTPNVSVKTSLGDPIIGVTVSYYSGGWKEFGVTDVNGLASKDIPPGSYTFRVSYAGASLDKTQNVGTNPSVTFQTTAVTMSLLSSSGEALSGGAQYYAGGWKTFGSGASSTTMELLPVSYTFRVGYGGATLDKTQNVATDQTVTFQTTAVTMSLISSTGESLNGGAQYYAGGWKTFDSGSTPSTMELLPVSYTFRVSYGGATLDKTQNVASSPLVTFQTVLVTFKLMSSTASELSGGAQYYAGSWKTFGSGTTSSTMELLPVSYTFRVSYGGASLDKTQNVASDTLVKFQTVSVTFKLLSSVGARAPMLNVFRSPDARAASQLVPQAIKRFLTHVFKLSLRQPPVLPPIRLTPT